MRIAVVGSVNLDLVARCERLPEPGETVSDAAFERHPGGKGANQAVAAARLGASVQLFAAVGDDDFGTPLIVNLEEEGVDAGTVAIVDGPTGIALILVDEAGENQIVVAPGANLELRADMVVLEEHDAVLCQLEIPPETVEAAAAQATFFCLNAAPARALPSQLVRRADLVVVNRHERDALAETPRLLAVTQGAGGAILVRDGEEIARASAPRIAAVDGTAAGDAFTACLVISLLEGRSHGDALRRSCAAGALAASRPGAQPSLPTAAEVDALLAATSSR